MRIRHLFYYSEIYVVDSSDVIKTITRSTRILAQLLKIKSDHDSDMQASRTSKVSPTI